MVYVGPPAGLVQPPRILHVFVRHCPLITVDLQFNASGHVRFGWRIELFKRAGADRLRASLQ